MRIFRGNSGRLRPGTTGGERRLRIRRRSRSWRRRVLRCRWCCRLEWCLRLQITVLATHSSHMIHVDARSGWTYQRLCRGSWPGKKVRNECRCCPHRADLRSGRNLGTRHYIDSPRPNRRSRRAHSRPVGRASSTRCTGGLDRILAGHPTAASARARPSGKSDLPRSAHS